MFLFARSNLPIDKTQVKYSGHQDKGIQERREHFLRDCRENGTTEVAFTCNGTNIQIMLDPSFGGECNFDKEPGKVGLKKKKFTSLNR